MKKLNLIQTELKAPKSQFNSFGKFHYRNVEDIQESVKPLLKKYDCTLHLSESIQEIGGRIYIASEAKIVCNETKEQCVSISFAREPETKPGMDVSQITGSAASYARKYALGGLLLIDDNKDADSDVKKEKKDVTAYQNIISKLSNLTNKDELKILYDSLDKSEQKDYKEIFLHKHKTLEK